MSGPTSARHVPERPAMSISYRESSLVNRVVLRCGLSDNSFSSNVRTFQHATFMPTEVENRFVCLSFLDNADLLSLILLPLYEQSACRGYWLDYDAKHLSAIPFLIPARSKQCSPRKAALTPLTQPIMLFTLTIL